MYNKPQLTMEQEFKLRSLAIEVESMTEAEAKKHLVANIKLGMMKDNMYKKLMKGDY